jgi:hypothetical protein
MVVVIRAVILTLSLPKGKNPCISSLGKIYLLLSIFMEKSVFSSVA